MTVVQLIASVKLISFDARMQSVSGSPVRPLLVLLPLPPWMLREQSAHSFASPLELSRFLLLSPGRHEARPVRGRSCRGRRGDRPRSPPLNVIYEVHSLIRHNRASGYSSKGSSRATHAWLCLRLYRSQKKEVWPVLEQDAVQRDQGGKCCTYDDRGIRGRRRRRLEPGHTGGDPELRGRSTCA